MEFSSTKHRKQVLIAARKRGVSLAVLGGALGLSKQRIGQLCGTGHGTTRKRNRRPSSRQQHACVQCGAAFARPASANKYIYCSKKCYGLASRGGAGA